MHSPLGGQGLNLGLGDAANLGWRLAATVRGWAPPGLLDTDETERHPIGAGVLDWTRAQVALLRGDERTEQLRKIGGGELLRVPAAMNRIVALSPPTAGSRRPAWTIGWATSPTRPANRASSSARTE